MSRGDRERPTEEEPIERVLKRQRPAQTSRTPSAPSTDREERREPSRPGGAKPGHEGHGRVLYKPPKTLTLFRRVAPHERRRAFALASGHTVSV